MRSSHPPIGRKIERQPSLRRQSITIYTLNLNGSPLKIEEPGGVTIEMTWAANDIYKESETDANGRLTLFEYDDRANLIKETIVAAGIGNVVTEFDYDLIYNKMKEKRVHNDGVIQSREAIARKGARDVFETWLSKAARRTAGNVRGRYEPIQTRMTLNRNRGPDVRFQRHQESMVQICNA